MPKLHAMKLLLLLSCAGCSSGAALRVLSSEAATPPKAESDPTPPPRDRPRIGAPGGSGAGARSVLPVQSGNETVGGLPAGMGSGAGRRG